MPWRNVCPNGDCILPAGHTTHPHTNNLARLINHRFDLLEDYMSDVAGIEAAALADLNTAVTDLSNRLGTLPQALADAQTALAAAQSKDIQDEAALSAALATVQQNLDQATAVAGDIESTVAKINALAPGASAEPAPAEPPAEPAPEPAPEPPPAEEPAPEPAP